MELDYIQLKQIKPSLTGYLHEAQEMIKAPTFPDEKGVHDVRVLMKRSRAALRLIMPQLDPVFSEREMKSLREVGRTMRLWREETVLRKSLKNLKHDYPLIFEKLNGYEKITGLMKKPVSSESDSEEKKIKLEGLRDMVTRTLFRVRFEPMRNLDPQLLLKELEATYITVADNYLICRNSPKSSNLHELRKRTKDFLYQLWFFRPLNPSVIKTLEKKLDEITSNLGKYNDLSQLISSIGYSYEYMSNPPEFDELFIIIKEKQDEYLIKVWRDVHKIFCPGQKLVNLLGFKLLVI